MPAKPAVADLGCGTGRSTLFLAERLGTRVTAVELAGRFCERLAERAEQRGLSALVDVRCGDMASRSTSPKTSARACTTRTPRYAASPAFRAWCGRFKRLNAAA